MWKVVLGVAICHRRMPRDIGILHALLYIEFVEVTGAALKVGVCYSRENTLRSHGWGRGSLILSIYLALLQ